MKVSKTIYDRNDLYIYTVKHQMIISMFDKGYIHTSGKLILDYQDKIRKDFIFPANN